DFSQHAAVFRCGLGGLGNDPQKVERPTPSLAFGIEAAEIFHQVLGRPRLIRQFLFSELPLAREVSRYREIRLNCGEQFRAILDDTCESLLDKAVEHLVNLLPRDMCARRKLQSFEPGMSKQHEVRSRLI